VSRQQRFGALPGICAGVAFALGAWAPCPAVAQVTRDSAGIEIVESERPVWSAGDSPMLASAPTLVIGDRPEPPYVLSRVAGAVRLADGRIVVADEASRELRFFDPAGTFLDAVGGRGGGPGEFRQLDALGTLAGDTLFAMSRPGTVSFFDPHGAFLRRMDVSRIPTGLPGGLAIVVAVLDDQSVVVGPIPRPSPRPRGTRWVDSIPLVAIGRDSVPRASFGTLPFMLMTMDGDTPRPPWFGPAAWFAGGGALYAGYGGEYAIRVYASGGALERIIRRRWTPARVTGDDIDEYVREWSKRWITATGPEAERRKRDLRDDPYADAVPAYAQFLVDRAGRLWVREAHLADAPAAGQLTTSPLVPSVWSVFGHGGRWLTDVTMPAHFMPTDIGAHYVLGIARDADGVETVVLYPYGTGARGTPPGR